MIFKEKDPLDDQLQELEAALSKPLPSHHRQRLEKDLAQIRAGLKGEQEAAYHINFHLKDSPNWAIIHDLRLDWNGRVAQIDHLLIDRLLEIYVVESKSFRTKVRHANGGWERLNFNHWEGIPCPVEQNERHIAVLKELVEAQGLAPTRLGIPMRPTLVNVVVVQPSCSIMGDYPGDAHIYRMDSLVKKIRSQDPSAWNMLKIIAPETLHAFAADLVAYHKPAPRREVPPMQPGGVIQPVAPVPASTQACQSCGGPLTAAEAGFCRFNKARFGGQLLCRKCQGYAPKETPRPAPAAPAKQESLGEEIAARCTGCGVGVDKKVAAFCRFNSKRFAGRILCRACQAGTVQ